MAGQDFARRWTARFGATPPLGHRLREHAGSWWLRIHSLPGASRYARTDDERRETRRRMYQAADAVLGAGRRCWVVVPEYELGRHGRLPERPELALAPALRVQGPDESRATVFRAARVVWRADAFEAVLDAIADDRRRALWATLDMSGVFAPYDGGADLVLADEARRDGLRSGFAGWLSDRSDGL